MRSFTGLPTSGSDLDTVAGYLRRIALRPTTTPARVGIELEAHVFDLGDWTRYPAWSQIQALAADLPSFNGGSVLTFEPGGQLELSGPPHADIRPAIAELQRDFAQAQAVAATHGLCLVSLGVDPVRPAQLINPRERYRAMAAYWLAVGRGSVAAHMMCSTAAVQVTFDAGPAAEWAGRVRLIQALGPIFVALGGGSPWSDGRRTGWQSTRQQIWAELVGPGPEFTEDPLAAWVEWALNSPVVLTGDQDGSLQPLTECVTLRQWASGEVLLAGRLPTEADLDRQVGLLFPPVRLRGTIEVRYLDALPQQWWPGVVSALATLIDVPQAAAGAWQVVGDPGYQQALVQGRLWPQAAESGLSDPLLRAAAARCLAIAHEWAGQGDVASEHPVAPAIARLLDCVAQGRNPADELLALPDVLADPIGSACRV